MVERREPIHGLLRLEGGSSTIDGLIGMVVFFVLLLLIVQSGFLVMSRSMVGASVDAAVRRLAADPAAEAVEDRLADEILATVPGAVVESLESQRTDLVARVTVRYRWKPPGPDFLPITMTIERTQAVVVAP
jgi:Flp pilus assembly protein TadG